MIKLSKAPKKRLKLMVVLGKYIKGIFGWCCSVGNKQVLTENYSFRKVKKKKKTSPNKKSKPDRLSRLGAKLKLEKLLLEG